MQNWPSDSGLSRTTFGIDALYPTDLTGIPEIFAFFWEQHPAASGARFTFTDVRNIRNVTKDLVWHNEDHHANRAICYCPVLYFDMLTAIFVDSEAFAPIDGHVAELLYEQQ